MCDVCEAEGIDTKFVNGKKSRIHSVKLYRVYKEQTAHIKMCHLHAIEIFALGEKRFLESHIMMVHLLSEKKSRFTAA